MVVDFLGSMQSPTQGTIARSFIDPLYIWLIDKHLEVWAQPTEKESLSPSTNVKYGTIDCTYNITACTLFIKWCIENSPHILIRLYTIYFFLCILY